MISTLACLATAIYFEARGEPTLGQIAVGQVIMSRVADPRYPDNVCDVVTEGYYYSWNPEIPIPYAVLGSSERIVRMNKIVASASSALASVSTQWAIFSPVSIFSRVVA